MALNALLSGDIYGGLPNPKITAFAGEEATGKTFFALSIVKNFLEQHETNVVIYFDTESAVTKNMMTSRGIDASRVLTQYPATVEDFRTSVLQMITSIQELNEKPNNILFVLDSLGNLSTLKELDDTESGKNIRDMTRAQVIKGAFRVITLALAEAHYPFILTNHTYQVVTAYYPTKEQSGGSGPKYAASTIVMLSKKKEKDDDKHMIGSLITAKVTKSRFTREDLSVTLKLNHVTGLDRYYGLLDIAIDAGIVKKLAKQVEFPDHDKPVYAKAVDKDPEKFFTQEILDQINEYVKKEFRYGDQT